MLWKGHELNYSTRAARNDHSFVFKIIFKLITHIMLTSFTLNLTMILYVLTMACFRVFSYLSLVNL